TRIGTTRRSGELGLEIGWDLEGAANEIDIRLAERHQRHREVIHLVLQAGLVTDVLESLFERNVAKTELLDAQSTRVGGTAKAARIGSQTGVAAATGAGLADNKVDALLRRIQFPIQLGRTGAEEIDGRFSRGVLEVDHRQHD